MSDLPQRGKIPQKEENKMKIVINRCYGGFSVSLAAARFMAERGNRTAIAELAEYDAKIENKENQTRLERKCGVKFYGYGYTNNSGPYARDDKDLIAAVEALGEKASGKLAKLTIVEIPKGTDWEIDDYDGMESVSEKHRVWR